MVVSTKASPPIRAALVRRIKRAKTPGPGFGQGAGPRFPWAAAARLALMSGSARSPEDCDPDGGAGPALCARGPKPAMDQRSGLSATGTRGGLPYFLRDEAPAGSGPPARGRGGGSGGLHNTDQIPPLGIGETPPWSASIGPLPNAALGEDEANAGIVVSPFICLPRGAVSAAAKSFPGAEPMTLRPGALPATAKPDALKTGDRKTERRQIHSSPKALTR